MTPTPATARRKVSPALLAAAALTVAIIAGWFAHQHFYRSPMDEFDDRRQKALAAISRLRDSLRAERNVRRELSAIAGTSLGKKIDVLNHRFSAGLSKIAETGGLRNVVVTHGSPVKQVSPLTLPSVRIASTQAGLKRALQAEPDFFLVRGTVKGVGDLRQILRTFAQVESQPWVHRVEDFVIKPAGKERDAFEVTIGVATLYVPDLLGTELEESPIAPARAELEQIWSPIASKNSFRRPAPVAKPAPVVVAAAAPPSDPPPADVTLPPPAPPPLEDWKLTGVAVGSAGVQAMLTNVRTNATITVQKGGAVDGAVLVEGLGESAVFEIDGKKFRVNNGQTLASREPVG
jgi:hypothetical protein